MRYKPWEDFEDNPSVEERDGYDEYMNPVEREEFNRELYGDGCIDNSDGTRSPTAI